MGALDVGTKGDHLHPGVFVTDDPALEARVDRLYHRISTSTAPVYLHRPPQEIRIGFRRPGGVTLCLLHPSAGKLHHRPDPANRVVDPGSEVGALTCENLHLPLVDPDCREVGRGLHQPRDRPGDREHPVRHRRHHPDERRRGLLAHRLAHLRLHRLDGDGELLLYVPELSEELLMPPLHRLGDTLCPGGSKEGRLELPGDRVVLVPSLEIDDPQGRKLPMEAVEYPGCELETAAPPLPDVDARVAPLETGDGETVRLPGCPVKGDREIGVTVAAAGAADTEMALLLGVDIYQPLCGEKVRIELCRPGETALLIDGEKALQGRVLIRSGEKGEHHCDGDPVVGPEGCLIRGDPVGLPPEPDRVPLKVVDCSRVFLADHVDVRLDSEGRLVLEGAGPAL